MPVTCEKNQMVTAEAGSQPLLLLRLAFQAKGSGNGPHCPPRLRRKNTQDNLVICCKECNTNKKTLLPRGWEE
jgi:hypothetical protein